MHVVFDRNFLDLILWLSGRPPRLFPQLGSIGCLNSSTLRKTVMVCQCDAEPFFSSNPNTHSGSGLSVYSFCLRSVFFDCELFYLSPAPAWSVVYCMETSCSFFNNEAGRDELFHTVQGGGSCKHSGGSLLERDWLRTVCSVIVEQCRSNYCLVQTIQRYSSTHTQTLFSLDRPVLSLFPCSHKLMTQGSSLPHLQDNESGPFCCKCGRNIPWGFAFFSFFF